MPFTARFAVIHGATMPLHRNDLLRQQACFAMADASLVKLTDVWLRRLAHIDGRGVQHW